MASRLVVSTFVSLDGVMQGPGGVGEDDSHDFPHGGWLPPHVDEGFGRIMGEQLERAALAGEAAQTVADLKERTDGEILVQGSSDLLRTLQQAELIDEYRLLVFPVILGQGKRLFAEGTTPAGLKVTGSTVTDAGVVYTTYEWAGKPSYGSVA